MVRFDFKNRRTQLIIGLVTLFCVFALWLRLLPMLNMGNTDVLMMVASDDPLYNLRQVEQILANFPNYAWYDPMSLFPTGMSVPWGSLFPTIIAVFCLITGATTRPEIISTGLLIPPLMGVMIVAVMYFVGKSCGDWKTGLFSFRIYCCCIRPVLLPLIVWIYGSSYRRSSFFHNLLPVIYDCGLFRKRHKNRFKEHQFL